MDFLKIKLVEYGFSIIVAPLAMYIFQLLKKYSYWVDALPVWTKRAFVTVTVVVFLAIGAVTGLDFGVAADTTTLDFLKDVDTAAIKTALAAGLAFLLHSMKLTKKL